MTALDMAKSRLEGYRNIAADAKIDSISESGLELMRLAKELEALRNRRDRNIQSEKTYANSINAHTMYQSFLIVSLAERNPSRFAKLRFLTQEFEGKAKASFQRIDVMTRMDGREVKPADIAQRDQWESDVMDDINAMTFGTHGRMMKAIDLLHRSLGKAIKVGTDSIATSHVVVFHADELEELELLKLALEFTALQLNRWLDDRTEEQQQ